MLLVDSTHSSDAALDAASLDTARSTLRWVQRHLGQSPPPQLPAVMARTTGTASHATICSWVTGSPTAKLCRVPAQRVTELHTARVWSAPAAALDSMPSLLRMGHRGAHDAHEKRAKNYLHIMFTSSRTAPLDLMLWGRSEFLKKMGRGGGVHLLIGRVHGERLQGAGGLATDVDIGIQQQRNKHLRIMSRAQHAARACVTP